MSNSPTRYFVVAILALTMAAPLARSSSMSGRKFPLCGPTITGLPSAAGSIMFCPPPGGSRLRPTKAQLARL